MALEGLQFSHWRLQHSLWSLAGLLCSGIAFAGSFAAGRHTRQAVVEAQAIVGRDPTRAGPRVSCSP